MKTKNERPKMKFLESALNDIISTIGSRPAESGGLLFGKEDDYIIRKFVFDKNAYVTRSTYTFNTDFLNPEIKRLWAEEGLSCIGFIHSHPKGYNSLSTPDVTYFNSMFESMPRKHYLTPIVFTAPDGGFKMNAHILPNGSKETILADIEILPDDHFDVVKNEESNEEYNNAIPVMGKRSSTLYKIHAFDKIIMIIWKWSMGFGLSWFLFKAVYIITNHLNKIWPS